MVSQICHNVHHSRYVSSLRGEKGLKVCDARGKDLYIYEYDDTQIFIRIFKLREMSRSMKRAIISAAMRKSYSNLFKVECLVGYYYT